MSFWDHFKTAFLDVFFSPGVWIIMTYIWFFQLAYHSFIHAEPVVIFVDCFFTGVCFGVWRRRS